MSDYGLYVSPFSKRYASRQMQGLFSDHHKFQLWRQLWVYLAQAEQQLGLAISDEQIAQMQDKIGDIDYGIAESYEAQLRHDVMAHVHTFGDACPLARPIIHLGATSCYVGDNADIIIMKEAMELILSRLVQTAWALFYFAQEYKDVPALGYTHFQAAQPVTIGKRATLWLSDLIDDIRQTEDFLRDLRPLGSKGTTGTQASFLELFDGDYNKVKQLDMLVSQKMGFEKPVAVSGQTYSRKVDSRCLNILSQIAQSAHKFSNDIRLLAHLKEMEEPFESKQIGSSAMAYKRNPMRSERMAALSRFLIANQQNAAMTAAEQWLERTLDDSANRRISIAEGFLAADGLMMLYHNVASGLVVYPKMAHKHLMEELPFMASENILMDAVKLGGDRQDLHERLRIHAQEAANGVKLHGKPNDLLDRIAQDPAFAINMDGLDKTLTPQNYIGCAALQVDDYLQGEAANVLMKYKDAKRTEEKIEV
ncbi:MAG: adenylosuccinate lyase [Clostridiales bacterium]|nr:adenylosuccinate lyase [Clostridiales bacterium]